MERYGNRTEAATEEMSRTNMPSDQEPRSRMRTQKKSGIWKTAAIGITVVAAVLGIAYVVRAQTFRTKFFPNTFINGIDASYKTPDEIEQIIRDEISNFQIIVKSRGNADEILKGTDVGLRYVSDNSVTDILKNQDILTWIRHNNRITEFEVETSAALDDVKFQEAVLAMKALDSSHFVSPENAKISEYIPDKGYVIVPEVQGNTVDIQKTQAYIRESMLTLKNEINLDTPDADVYAAPTVFANDAGLRALRTRLNELVNVRIEYSKGITLDGNTIHTWLTVGENNEVSLNEDLVREYVKQTIAPGYDTAYKPKTLKTAAGRIVTVKGGDYGWKVNQSAEAGKISELILAGESTSRDPEFSQKAASLGENDYGNSYVEVDLASQKMYLYKDGNMILSSSFVSGNVARGWATPGGAYSITYTQRNATLNGEDYSTPVNYWMPFNRGIGFHDAPWRGAFGGQIYRTGGSHGCINLPPSVAKTLFAHVSKGFPVLCHFGGGVTETVPEQTPSESAPELTEAQTIAPGETVNNADASTQATQSQKPSEDLKQAETKPEETLAPETDSADISDAAPSAEENESLQGPGENGSF